MPHNDPCRRLAWDSEFFGFAVAMVEGGRLAEDRATAILDWCRRERIRCAYFLADVDDPLTLRLAQRHGFELQDVRVTSELDLTAWKALDLPPAGISVRPGRIDDIPALRRIAATAYGDSRFYFDRRFDRVKCDLLYTGWIESFCRQGPENVRVVERGGRLEGYLCCEPAGPAAGRIGLTAVDAPSRGRGVGRHLLADAVRWFRERGIERLTVVTQARNVVAERLYQRCGFLTKAVQLWYHRWFEV
jgi:dTDP-4-amino-4,6-dideoxy-D-galactose acyltransferase